MKTWVFPAGLAVLLGFSATAAINSASQDVLRMVQNGVSESVIANYVNNSTSSFNLSADDIVYLQQSGVPQSIIADMQTHDSGVAQQLPQVYQNDQNLQPQQTYQTDQNYVNQGSYSQYPDQTTAQVNPPDVYYDQQQQPIVQVAAQQAPPQVASFYDSLRPYGNWIYLEGYGWCWQPYEVRTVSNWQPYCDNGQWVYSEDGWYWQSYYNWGWAPFHYGRWMHANCGWVWFPDTVWAPSWVCWRTSADYCGWAPLPPSGFVGYGRPGFHFAVGFGGAVDLGVNLFTFIHLGDIFHGGHDHGYRHYEIPRTQVTQIYNRTKVINNVTVVNNYYARNPGISRQTVERVAGPVHVAPVRTSTQDPRQSRPGVVKNGSQVAIVRPQRPPTPEKTTPIVAHRLSRDARTVPATPPAETRSSRQTRPSVTTTSANQTTTAPRASSTLRTPRSSDYQHNTTQRPTDTSRNRGVTEVPQPSRTSETPRPTTRTEVPTPSTPQTSELPHNTSSPRVTETPHPTSPRTTELPNPTPRVSEVPRPTQTPQTARTPRPTLTPQVGKTPHPATTPAPTVRAQPEVHRSYPQTTPRVETPHPAIRESAGSANPTPHAQPAPHVATPAPAPHVSAPPAHVSTPAPHVSAPVAHPAPVHVAPPQPAHPPQSARPAAPPGQERRNDDGHGH
jgi:hypothetical protein